MTQNVTILSVAGVLPPNKIEIDTGEANNNEFSGYDNGHFSDKRFIWRIENPRDVLTLAEKSISDALALAKLTTDDIDYFILTLAWSDDPTAQEAALLAKSAGLACPSIGLAAGTNAGAAAIEIAGALISSGQCQRVAIASACNYGHFFREDDPVRHILSDGAACLILGSGAGPALLTSHTVSTADYPLVEYVRPSEAGGKGYVTTPAGAGQYVAAHIGQTIAECCKAACGKAGCRIEDIDLFYIYAPVHWVPMTAAQALGVDIARIYPSFLKYGSLGPALNAIILADIAQNRTDLTPGSKVLSMGFGSMSSATASIFEWQAFPNKITVES